MLLSEDAGHLQSSTLSLASGGHSHTQLPPPTLDAPFTLSCSTCSQFGTRTLTSRDGRVLVLTDSRVQVFTPTTDGEDRSQFKWNQSLALDVGCRPLYLQVLSVEPDAFVVVCNTLSSFGYHVIAGSSELFQIHPLHVPTIHITDLIVGSFKPFLQPETDAFVYIKDGELTFGTFFDGQASLPIILDYDTLCDSVVSVYPLPKSIQGRFRFILDCLQQNTAEMLRYKITLSPDPSFPDSVHLLPSTLAYGTAISSLDSKYFAIVHNTSIAVVRTEQTTVFRVQYFQHELRDVSFTDSMEPTLSIASPGQNHMLLHVDSFLADDNTSVIELEGSPAFCPDDSPCLPHNTMAHPSLPQSNFFFTFTANSTEDNGGSFNLILYDITIPSQPLIRIENVTIQPKFAFPKAILPSTSMTPVHLHQSTPAPSHTHASSPSVSLYKSTVPTGYLTTSPSTSFHSTVSTHFSSTSKATVDSSCSCDYTSTSEEAVRSSSTAITQTPTQKDTNNGDTLILLTFTSIISVLVVLLLLLIIVVIGLLIFFMRRLHQSNSEHSLHTFRDEEKCAQMLSADPTCDWSNPPLSATNPTTSTTCDKSTNTAIHGDTSTSVRGVDNVPRAVNANHSSQSQSSSSQLTETHTLDSYGSVSTVANGGDRSGVSSDSAVDTPSTTP